MNINKLKSLVNSIGVALAAGWKKIAGKAPGAASRAREIARPVPGLISGFWQMILPETMFQDPVTTKITNTLFTAAAIGAGFIFLSFAIGGLAGIKLALIGIVILLGSLGLVAKGWNDLEIDPNTKSPLVGGVLMRGSVPMIRVVDGEEQTTTLKGLFLTVPFFPVRISVVEFPLTQTEWTFNVKVISHETPKDQSKPDECDHLEVEGTIRLSVKANPLDMKDFIQSGGSLDAIKPQVEEIVGREARRFVNGETPGHGKMTAEQITQQSNLISEYMQSHFINKPATPSDPNPRKAGILEEGDFGLTFTKAQAEFPVPEAVRKSMSEVLETRYKSKARRDEITADVEAAEALRDKWMVGRPAGTQLPSLDPFIQQVLEMRRVRDGASKSYNINQAGKGGKVDMFIEVNDRDEKKGGKGGGKGGKKGSE